MKRYIAFLLAVLMLCLAGCGNKAASVEMDVESVYEEMEGTLPEMVIMDEKTMLNFCGIEAEMCNQVVVAVCADGLRADEIWLIEAADEEDFNKFIATCKDLSFYDTGETPVYGDKIICLSTCEYTLENGRLVMAAYRIS